MANPPQSPMDLSIFRASSPHVGTTLFEGPNGDQPETAPCTWCRSPELWQLMETWRFSIRVIYRLLMNVDGLLTCITYES